MKLETHVTLNLDPVMRLKARINQEIKGQGTEFQGCLKRWALRYRTYVRRRFDRFSKGGGNWAPLALSTIIARHRKRNLKGRVKVVPDNPVKKSKSAKTSTKKRPSLLSKLRKAVKSRKTKTKLKNLGKIGKSLFKATKRSARKAGKAAKKGAKSVRRAIKNKHKRPPKTTLARDTRRGGKIVKVKGAYSTLRDTGTLFGALDPVFSSKPGALEKLVDGSIVVGFGGPGAYTQTKGKRFTVADIAAFHQTGGGKLPKRTILVMPDKDLYKAMREDLRRTVMRIIKRAE